MLTDLPVVAPGVAIFEYVHRHLDMAGRLPSDLDLPDDDKVMSGGLRWAAGAMDGTFGHHGSPRGADRAEEVAGLLTLTCLHPSVRNLRTLYDGVTEDDVLGYVDALIERLAREGAERHAVHAIGRWLATTAADRGPVKLGIALLGVAGSDADLPVVRTLGAHEEFTLYCATAVTNLLPDPEPELWALAMAVDGWGRIHCVERLRDTTDPDIRAWLLRAGYRNSIMYEYLAYTAATSGDLLGALRGDVDRELLTAAGEILRALIEGGPAEDIDDYESGADAVEAFLTHMDTHADPMHDFATVAAIRTFLSREEGWDRRAGRGWTASRREAFETTCDRILHGDTCAARVAEGLAAADRGDFHHSTEVARILGIDTFDAYVEKIRADPSGNDWYGAWQVAGAARAPLLADLARTLLPAGEIATGPAEENGVGERWRTHTAFGWTVQALREHPGVGGDLLLTALRSPLVPNRNMALTALEEWPPSTWPPGTTAAVEELARTDPKQFLRKRADVLAQRFI